MEGKYSLTENVMNYNGRKVYQIKALKDFGDGQVTHRLDL